MNRSQQYVYRGPRSNRYSRSKYTNWTSFQPWYTTMDRLFWRDLCSNRPASTDPLVVLEPTHHAFIRPVEREDIERALARVPSEFVEELAAVFVLGGSAKQAKTIGRCYFYGAYKGNRICLIPFPKRLLSRTHRRGVRPHLVREWERAGATITPTSRGLKVVFTREAIRTFYIRDVLMHELGHHVDRRGQRCKRKSEWFATEYGYRLPGRDPGLGSGDHNEC